MNFSRLINRCLLGGLLTSIGSLSVNANDVASQDSHAQVELLGVARLAGTTLDLSGQSMLLEDGSRADYLGGMSAIEYAGSGNRFLLLADRGAGDGAVSYACRFHEVELAVDPASHEIQFKLLATHLFKSSQGEQLIGSLAVHEKELLGIPSQQCWTAFDPEGIRRLADGTLLISDEYGPHVAIAEASGRIIRELPVPESFKLHKIVEGQATHGLFPNRGLEGVTITPSGARTIAVLQSPLIQDGEIVGDKCFGLNCRWLVFSNTQPAVKQVVYQLEERTTGVSEVLAIDEDRFLVLERDSNSGPEALFKKIFVADISQATDVTDCDSLPPDHVPAGVNVAKKQLLLDLLDPRFGLGGEKVAEKPEGLSWGPTLPDGRRTLWVCCDNDCDPAIESQIYCFAISEI